MPAQTESRTIAARYVTALLNYARSAKAEAKVEQDLLRFRDVLSKTSELSKFLRNPLITRAQAADSMEMLLTQLKANEVTKKFFRLLAHQRRLPLIGEIIEGFLSKLAEARGEVIAELRVARPLPSAQRDKITAALAKATGKQVRLTVRQQPTLMGGLMLRIGGRMLDRSVSGAMDRLRASLKQGAEAA